MKDYMFYYIPLQLHHIILFVYTIYYRVSGVHSWKLRRHSPRLLLAQRLDLHLEILPAPLEAVDLLRLRAQLHADLRTGLVQQVHGLAMSYHIIRYN